MDDGQTGLEGNIHGLRDQDDVTEHTDREGGPAGDSTPGTTAGECVCGVSTGY